MNPIELFFILNEHWTHNKNRFEDIFIIASSLKKILTLWKVLHASQNVAYFSGLITFRSIIFFDILL